MERILKPVSSTPGHATLCPGHPVARVDFDREHGHASVAMPSRRDIERALAAALEEVRHRIENNV